MKDIIRLNPSHSLSTNATMNTVREIQQINEQELQRGIAGTPASWHAKYSQAAWVYVGNLEQTSLTEGDVICVLSQYGEIEDFDLVRDQETGASRGFAFCKYEDARSCVLAVDNLCGVMLCGRTLRVDHVENYRLPKHLAEKEKADADNAGPDGSDKISSGAATNNSNNNGTVGRAYQGSELASQYTLQQGHDLFAPSRPAMAKGSALEPLAAKEAHYNDKNHERRSYSSNESDNDDDSERRPAAKKRKKEKKQHKRLAKEERKRERHDKRIQREERREHKRQRRDKEL